MSRSPLLPPPWGEGGGLTRPRGPQPPGLPPPPGGVWGFSPPPRPPPVCGEGWGLPRLREHELRDLGHRLGVQQHRRVVVDHVALVVRRQVVLPPERPGLREHRQPLVAEQLE